MCWDRAVGGMTLIISIGVTPKVKGHVSRVLVSSTHCPLVAFTALIY